MNSRAKKRAAGEGVNERPFKRRRHDDAGGRIRDRIDFGEGSSMTSGPSTSALSELDPSITFEQEALVLPSETPCNSQGSEQPVRYLRNYRILRLKSQDDFSMSSIQRTSLEFEEQEELPHFLGFVRSKPGDPYRRKERTAMHKHQERFVLSSKVWRSWWNRDPDPSEQYVLLFPL
jgi:hypothetical protein